MENNKKSNQINNIEKTKGTNLEQLKEGNIKKTKYNIKNIFQTLILICAGICIIYGLYTIVTGETENKETKSQQKLEYKEVKELYNYISEIWPYASFYEKDRVLLSTLDENVLFGKLIILEGLNSKTYDTENCTDYTQPCKIGEISYEDAITKLSSRYGNVSLTKESYSSGLTYCEKKEDKYVCYIIFGGIEDMTTNLSNMVNYLETDSELQIFDKYLKYEESFDGTYKCYIDNSMTQECSNQETFGNDLNILSTEELLNKYGQEYVHVFLKGKDGKFYWYSSQMKKTEE